MAYVKYSYPDGECPDCRKPISMLAISGDECENCSHVFRSSTLPDERVVARDVPQDRVREVFDFCVAHSLWCRFTPLLENVWEVAVTLDDRGKLQEFFSE